MPPLPKGEAETTPCCPLLYLSAAHHCHSLRQQLPFSLLHYTLLQHLGGVTGQDVHGLLQQDRPAVAKNPKILLCDEPTGALDYNTGKQVLKILQDKARNEGATVIIVTHNGALAPIADRVIRMHDARVQSIELNATPQDIDSLEY